MFSQFKNEIRTQSRKTIIDITELVTGALQRCGQVEGLINVFIPHTTACVTINERDEALWRDITGKLASLVEPNGGYKHRPNADAHIMASIIKPSVTIPFTKGTLNLGTYQRVLFIDLDGPRTRDVIITITG